MTARTSVHYLRGRQHPLGSAIRTTLGRSALHDAFNPSIAVMDDRTVHCTVRVPDDRASSSTWLLQVDADTMRGTVVENLSLRNRRSAGVRTNDARLFRLDGELYATFNTGHPRSRVRCNEVLVQQVAPQLSDPIPVEIDPRRRIEKNLMFEMTDGVLSSTYRWDSPPCAVDRSERTWTVAPSAAHPRELTSSRPLDRGQGTPWVPWGSGSISVIHEKPRLGPLRSYRGRIARRASDGTITLGARLLHSRSARRGTAPRRNPRLLHCTYFAGLTVLDGELIASYGINDHDFGVARLDGPIGGLEETLPIRPSHPVPRAPHEAQPTGRQMRDE